MCLQHKEIERAGAAQYAPLQQHFLRHSAPALPRAEQLKQLPASPRQRHFEDRPVSKDITTVQKGQGAAAKKLIPAAEASPVNISKEVEALLAQLRAPGGKSLTHRKRGRR